MYYDNVYWVLLIVRYSMLCQIVLWCVLVYIVCVCWGVWLCGVCGGLGGVVSWQL